MSARCAWCGASVEGDQLRKNLVVIGGRAHWLGVSKAGRADDEPLPFHRHKAPDEPDTEEFVEEAA